jgi:hypothetical protein
MEKIKRHIHLIVSCEDSEIDECLRLIKSQIDFHLVDIRQKSDELSDGVWNDSRIDFLKCSPLMPTVLVHDGHLSREILESVNHRIYLDAANPILLIGPGSPAPSGFYPISFEILKMWTE